MQEVKIYKIDGAEIKRDKSGCLIVGFSSQLINDGQLIALRQINEDFFLAFYSCGFSSCSLESLKNTRTKTVGIFHSSFGDEELSVLSRLGTIESIKLHGTKVSARCVFEIRQLNNKINITS